MNCAVLAWKGLKKQNKTRIPAECVSFYVQRCSFILYECFREAYPDIRPTSCLTADPAGGGSCT